MNSIPDAPRALNGLQLENGGTVSKVAAAVDGSEKAIHAALETGADLLLLHHGIFWQPMQPITGIVTSTSLKLLSIVTVNLIFSLNTG